MPSLPSFAFWPKDFAADTQHYTDQEIGAYIRLLMHQWLTGEIPDPATARGRRQLDRIIDSFSTVWQTIEPHFPKTPDGRLQNPRLESERERANTAHAAAVARGKRSADARARSKQEQAQERLELISPEAQPFGTDCFFEDSSGMVIKKPRQART